MWDENEELMEEAQRIAEGRGPLDTHAQRESDRFNDEGWVLHCESRFEEAIRCFDKAIRLNPRHALAMNNKGLSLRRLGRLEEAIQWFDRAIDTTPRFVKPYSNKGETLGMMKRRAEAAEWFHKALLIEPGYDRAIQGLEAYCKPLSRTAGITLERVLQLQSEYPDALNVFLEGGKLLSIARFQSALQRFDEALRLEPNVPEFLDGKAECLCNLGRFREAFTCAKKATNLNPSFTSAWVNLSWACAGMGKDEESLQYSKRAIEIEPNHDGAWNNAGIALMRLGRYSEAIERFNSALAVNPYHASARMYKAACLRKTEHPEYMFICPEALDFNSYADLVCGLLEKGHYVAIALNLNEPQINWGQIIDLTQRYEKLIVMDILDRSTYEIHTMADRLNQMGGARLALDLTLRAEEKSRGS